MYLRPQMNSTTKNTRLVQMFCTPSEMPSSSDRRMFRAVMESLPRWDCLKMAMPSEMMTMPITIPRTRRTVGRSVFMVFSNFPY